MKKIEMQIIYLIGLQLISCHLCENVIPRRLKLSISLSIFHLQNLLFRLKSVIIMLSLLVLSKTLESHLIHTSPLFPMSTTSVTLFRVRFILLAGSENILRKRILSALSMPSLHVHQNCIIAVVCFRDCRIPRQD